MPDHHNAVRSVGFASIGQVTGGCAYREGYTGRWRCTSTVGDDWWGTFAPQQFDVVEIDALREARYNARMLAVDRMREQCWKLGADGVVAVRLTTEQFPGGTEYRATGTAIRAAGDVRPHQPFTADLTGQEFATLMTAGWVPCGLALGLSVAIRHDDYRTVARSQSCRNGELIGHTMVLQAARDFARRRLYDDCVSHGGQGIVVRTTAAQLSKQGCTTFRKEHDHLAEAIMTGTMITPFRHVRTRSPLPVVSLT